MLKKKKKKESAFKTWISENEKKVFYIDILTGQSQTVFMWPLLLSICILALQLSIRGAEQGKLYSLFPQGLAGRPFLPFAPEATKNLGWMADLICAVFECRPWLAGLLAYQRQGNVPCVDRGLTICLLSTQDLQSWIIFRSFHYRIVLEKNNQLLQNRVIRYSPLNVNRLLPPLIPLSYDGSNGLAAAFQAVFTHQEEKVIDCTFFPPDWDI